ncbi:hypothetical protein [Actinomyces sp. MRS3W]|uniref:hypothetical protein n=1 Tax=Actinomyces sp. MRS3W TaxID=2800796 RepID=UPI0028FD48F5|nr:hypothetical protein [Actinomyces sp. MRS3W]MDU0348405.1 hypothetical protein [Actinomyces sp. MRS3W]
MSLEIITAVAGSVATGIVTFFVSRHRYRDYLMAKAAVGGTITDARLLNTLRAIVQAVTTAAVGAGVSVVLLVVAGQLLNPLQVMIICGGILLLTAALAWVYGRFAVLAELARMRHLELPYGSWGLFLANGHF